MLDFAFGSSPQSNSLFVDIVTSDSRSDAEIKGQIVKASDVSFLAFYFLICTQKNIIFYTSNVLVCRMFPVVCMGLRFSSTLQTNSWMENSSPVAC